MSDLGAPKPALTIDLIGPEGNVYALIATACITLERAGQFAQAQTLREWFRTVPPKGGVSYDDVRRRVEQDCDVTWVNDKQSPEVE